ncbi:MAG: YicC family protein [Muribaculaceae bacterium]|nr:YicC family protein [Muribaculaceae bacterium]
MILSMTGFGKAVKLFKNKKITAEVKSLNSKQLDLNVKLPQCFRSIELELRTNVAKALARGKVELSVTCETIDGSSTASINMETMRQYMTQIRQMSKELDIDLPTDWFATLLRMPDVFKNESANTEANAEEMAAVHEAVNDALVALNDFRTQEGRKLEAFFEEKIVAISQLHQEIDQYEATRVERIKARMTDGLSKIEGFDFDKNRFEQELIYYIEKLDITEEHIRLNNHLDYFLDTLHSAQPGQGKKLGFISQEIGREINTMGSKSNQAEMQKIVVKMKDQLEQIKEQVLNVL